MPKPPKIREVAHIREWRLEPSFPRHEFHRIDGPAYEDGDLKIFFINGECVKGRSN